MKSLQAALVVGVSQPLVSVALLWAVIMAVSLTVQVAVAHTFAINLPLGVKEAQVVEAVRPLHPTIPGMLAVLLATLLKVGLKWALVHLKMQGASARL